jgi:hypothetical protein
VRCINSKRNRRDWLTGHRAVRRHVRLRCGAHLVFASAIRDVSVAAHHPRLAAYLIAFMALPAAGIGVFAYPHPAHNFFRMSELIRYQARLAFALAWRHDPRAKTLVGMSWIFFVLIWGAIALNLSAFAAPVWAYVKPVHGLAQRALFAAWFGWCAVLRTLLLGETGEFRSLSFVVTYFESVSRNFDDHVIRQLCVRPRW